MASAEEAIKLKVQILLEQELKNLDKAMQGASTGIQKTLNKALKDSEKSSKNVGKSFEDNAQAARDIEMGLRGASKESANISKGLSGLASSGMAVQKAFSFSKGQIAGIFGIAGISGMISGTRAWRSELLGLNEEFAGMSNSLGSTGKAMGVYWSVLGKTGATAGTVKASMKTLDEQGLKPASEGFERLTLLGANLQQSTGVAADTWGQLNGKLSFNWKAPIASIEKINSVLISSGLSASQMTQVINGMNGSLENLNGFAKDGAKSAVALAAGYVGATKAMTQMGISTQKATQFMDKLLDPEHIQDNLLLLSKAGISYYDFTQMLTSEGGKQNFFDKLGQGLPRLAQQLEQIRDPITRMQQAKALGLPIEIAQKLAAAGPGQMQSVMRQAMNDAKNKEALEKKQQQAKDAAAKLDERLHLIRMQLFSKLLPIFESALPKAMNLLNQLFQRGGQLFGFIGERLNVVFQNLAPVFDAMLKGEWDKVPEKLGEGFIKITTDAIQVLTKTILPMVGQAFTQVLPNVLKAGWTVLKAIWSESKIAGLIATIYAGAKVFGPAIQVGWKIREWAQQERLIRAVKGRYGIGGRDSQGGIGNILKILKNPKQLISGGKGKIASFMMGEGVTLGKGGGALTKMGLGSIASKLGNLAKFAGPIGLAIGALTGGFQAIGDAAKIMGKGDTYSNLNEAQREKIKNETVQKHVESGSLAFRQKTDAKGGSRELEAFKTTQMASGAYKNINVTAEDKTRSFIAGAGTLGIAPLIDKLFNTNVTGAIAKNFDKVLLLSMPAVGLGLKGFFEVVDAFSNKKLSENVKAELDYFQTRTKMGEKLNKGEQKRYDDLIKQSADSRTSVIDGFKNLTSKVKNFFANLGIVEKFKEFWSGITDIFTKFDFTKIKEAFSSVWTGIKDKWNKVVESIGRGIDKYLSLPWFNFTYGAKLAISKLGLGIRSMVGSILPDSLAKKFGMDKSTIDADEAIINKSDSVFKMFSEMYEGNYSVGTKISKFREIAKRNDITPALKEHAKAAADLYTHERAEREAAEKEKADVARKQLEELRATKKAAEKGAGYGAMTAEHTKPRIERSSVNSWIDFLRSSGMIEAGVVY